MKKTVYMAPAISITNVELQPLMEPSITSVGGNAGITKGEDDETPPTTADTRRRRKTVWDDEEDEQW